MCDKIESSTSAQATSDEDRPHNDASIVCRVLRGEKEEFRHLVTAYQNRIYCMIMRQVGDSEVARDLTQEVFLKAYRHLGQFRKDARFTTWLTRIALNHTNTYFTSRKYKNQKRTLSFEQDTRTDAISDDNLETERQRKVEQIRLIISKLKPKYRDVLVLRCFEEKSYEEVATLLGIPIGTVRSRLNTARLQVRKAYSGE